MKPNEIDLMFMRTAQTEVYVVRTWRIIGEKADRMLDAVERALGVPSISLHEVASRLGSREHFKDGERGIRLPPEDEQRFLRSLEKHLFYDRLQQALLPSSEECKSDVRPNAPFPEKSCSWTWNRVPRVLHLESDRILEAAVRDEILRICALVNGTDKRWVIEQKERGIR